MSMSVEKITPQISPSYQLMNYFIQLRSAPNWTHVTAISMAAKEEISYFETKDIMTVSAYL